jgi:tetratricopeptide (TPR) repeat protein
VFFLTFSALVFAHEDIEGQVELINKKLAVLPDNYDQLFMRGRAYLKANMLSEALSDLKHVLSLYPENPEPLIYRGLAYHKQGLHKQALQDLDSYIGLGDPHYLAYEVRASVFKSLGMPEEAVRDYTSAARLRPKPSHFSERAQLLYQLGKLNEAIASYEEGLTVLGDSVPIILGLVDFQMEAGLYGDALEWVHKIKRRADRKEEWTLKEAEIHAAAGHKAAAEAAYTDVLDKLEEYQIQGRRVTQLMLLQKARALKGLGRNSEAREVFQSIGPAAVQLQSYQKLQEELEE